MKAKPSLTIQFPLTRWSIGYWSLVVVLSFSLRLYRLDTQPIWWDEAISIHLATSSLADLLADRAANVHPPLYFLFLKVWTSIAGTSAFSVRFLSVWSNTLLVPAAYTFARRWISRRTAKLATLLVAFFPLYVIYSQEARVYALLPLTYLALLTLMRRLTHGARTHLSSWLLLAAVETIGLYLHYVFIFPIVYANVVLLLTCRRAGELPRWAVSQGLVLLLLIPWIAAVIPNLPSVVDMINAPFVEPLPLDYFACLLWTFQWSGLTAGVGYAPIRWAVLILGLLITAGLSLLALDGRTRRPAFRLLADWLAPLSGAILMWKANPLSHPRYIAIFTVALLLLVTYLLDRLSVRPAGAPLAFLLALSLLATTVLSLRAYFFDHRFAKDDTRGVAARLSDRAGPGDLILVPPEDWSVPYYYNGPARIEMVWPDEAWKRLGLLTRRGQTVFLVDYYRASLDPAGLIPFGLEAAGSLVDRWGFKGLFVRVYRLDRPVTPPSLKPTGVRFGPLQLTGVWIEQNAAADTALSIALRWQPIEPTDVPLGAGLRIRGDEGWTWAAIDGWLLDSRGNPTDRWTPGREITTYHLLPLPPGTPPLTYTITLGLYHMEEGKIEPLDLVDEAGNPQGQSLGLGTVSLGQPLGLKVGADRALLWDTPVEIARGLLLEGASLDRETVSSGQPIYVTLCWRAVAPPPTPITAELVIEQQGEILVAVAEPVGGRYPVDRWAPGQTVVEHRRLVIPPTAASGTAVVVLRVGERHLDLGSVQISTAEHRFELPPMGHNFYVRFDDVAELLGYDLVSAEVAAGNPVTITLYWRALEGATQADYTIFTHILAEDGRLVGQHDGPPAEGARPTRGWIAGEIIVDRHVMIFREPYAGPARIEVGLYNALTLERVATEKGETFALLPTTLTVR
ncbi:MAG TPA: hypothetical protein EYH27_06660 [Anaerolineales bacterium]|nr:hypothetical protein [Anaerolineales bacterium]